jgi:RimJ/RimL family protein N-acetyltransferase
MQMLNPDDFVITTPNFRLSVMQETAVNTYVRLFTDEQLMRRISAPLTVEAATRDALVAVDVSTATFVKQLYLHVESEEPAGLFSILVSKADNSVEVGIMLLRQFHQTGFAEAVLKCVCSRLFARYPLNYIQCKIHKLNFAAQRLAGKVGFLKAAAEDIYILEKSIFSQISSLGAKYE